MVKVREILVNFKGPRDVGQGPRDTGQKRSERSGSTLETVIIKGQKKIKLFDEISEK